MNTPTITMAPEAAQQKLEAYRAQLRRRTDEEYQAAVLGYEALAKGTPLIDLVDVFNRAGLDDTNRPRLAIARADRKQVTVSRSRLLWGWSGTVSDGWWFSTLKISPYSYPEGSLLINVPYRLPSNIDAPRNGYALVPMVPADVRPVGQLRDFFVLWEVEQWADKPLLTVPDYDPYLLQHLIGTLYAVIAEWDLTDLERAIMTGRRNA